MRHRETQAQHIAEMGNLWNPDSPIRSSRALTGAVIPSPPSETTGYPAIISLNHYLVHDLRHTFSVNCLRAGDDPKTLQENMGHYSAAFMLDRYCHVTDTMRHESAERM